MPDITVFSIEILSPLKKHNSRLKWSHDIQKLLVLIPYEIYEPRQSLIVS